MFSVNVKHIRDGLVEEEHFGVVAIGHCEKVVPLPSPMGKVSEGRKGVKLYNNLNFSNPPYYLRSCAKPLQASLMIDWGTDEFFGFTEEEIALCCASHAGEKIHTDIAQNILDKIGLDKTYLKCGIHKPLSKTRQNEMLLSGEKETELHNNCSGKHLMMLAICRQKGWDLENYYKSEHPLQIAIKNKIYELCEVVSPLLQHFLVGEGAVVGEPKANRTNAGEVTCHITNVTEGVDYPITTDGCGVPIVSMPLENMVKGYLNLFCNPKYEKIKNAFLNNPYVIGGEDRTDTKIIQNSENIVAKVGAGGLCVVVNTEKHEGFAVKIIDCDMKARELVVIEMLKQLNWADIKVDKTIKTLHGQVVGNIETEIHHQLF